MPKEKAGGPFYEVTSKLYIHLPPCFATKPVEGIQEQLNGFLMRYVPQVDGVVLAHSELKLLETAGRIINESPYSHFWISVKLLIWRPRRGSILSGTINLQSPDHIGLLLYGIFNASIPSEHIPKDKYEFNAAAINHQKKRKAPTDGDDDSDGAVNGFLNGEWVVKGTGESIGDEGVIEFEVTDLIRTNDMLTVTGSLKNVPVMMRRPSIMTPVLTGSSKIQNVKALNAVDENEDDDDDAEEGVHAGVKRSAQEESTTAEAEESPATKGTAAATTASADQHENKRIKKEKSDKAEKKEKKEKKDKKDKEGDKSEKKEKKHKKNKEHKE